MLEELQQIQHQLLEQQLTVLGSYLTESNQVSLFRTQLISCHSDLSLATLNLQVFTLLQTSLE